MVSVASVAPVRDPAPDDPPTTLPNASSLDQDVVGTLSVVLASDEA